MRANAPLRKAKGAGKWNMTAALNIETPVSNTMSNAVRNFRPMK